MPSSLFGRLRAGLRPSAAPSPFWRGAASGVLLLALAVWLITGYHFRTGLPPAVMALLGGLAGLLLAGLFGGLSLLAAYAGRAMPFFFIAAIGGAIGALITARFTGFRWPEGLYYPAGFFFLWVNAVLFGSGWTLAGGLRKKGSARRRSTAAWAGVLLLTLLLDGAGLYWLARAGRDPFPLTLPANEGTAPALPDNAGEAGAFALDSFTYGSGADRRRPEFAAGAAYRTPAVDASRLLPDWKGKKKRWRERYWGFGVTNFPLNGRVWMPRGDGPFPLVLIVHGNHGMEDFSDPGYAYLGRLLASRGCIAVSVDENFLNGTWSGDFRGREMPARAWLLLQHLRQWRNWNARAGHPLAGKADLDRVLLIGHSRGGEAVAIAAAFNRLSHFPDDARERFDFGFGIRGLVAVAPTDKRYARRIELENVSYLTLQGSYDSDEASFFGRRQYRRVAFTDTAYHFRAGLLVHRANHGQFNTTWGLADTGVPGRWLLNLEPLLSGEEQRQIARVYIGAFAGAVLHGQRAYLPLFRDPATAAPWLPATHYLPSFADANTRILLDFEEDIDLTRGPNGIQLQGTNLRLWREEELTFRDSDSQRNNALVLGWAYPDSLPPPPDSTAAYSISLPGSLSTGGAAALILSVAPGNPADLKDPNRPEKIKPAKKKAPQAETTPDFTVRLVDRGGRSASLPLSRIRQLAPRLQVQFMKTKSLNTRFGAPWEAALESFILPFARLDRPDPAFDPAALARVELVFDRTARGVVVIDEIGLEVAN